MHHSATVVAVRARNEAGCLGAAAGDTVPFGIPGLHTRDERATFASSEWSASPLTRSTSKSGRRPDEEEFLVFDAPVTEGCVVGLAPPARPLTTQE
jgi:hypothetical protein